MGLFGRPLLESEMTEWFDQYNFDYVLLSNHVEIGLCSYMKFRDDFELVYECTNDNISLYQRIH